MKCALAGCEYELTPEQVEAGYHYHTRLCGLRDPQCKVRGPRPPNHYTTGRYRPSPVLRVVYDDEDFTMTCLHCGVRYDGRKGPWIGLCSLTCVGAHVMSEAAGQQWYASLQATAARSA